MHISYYTYIPIYNTFRNNSSKFIAHDALGCGWKHIMMTSKKMLSQIFIFLNCAIFAFHQTDIKRGFHKL
jgi:hypothetical protein